MGDTSWFPKPRPKPVPKPPPMSRLLVGTLLPVVAIAGLIVALSSSHSHQGTKTGTTSTLSGRQQSAANAAASERAAFDSCMKSMGAGGGGRGGFGRFGGGVSRSAMQNQLNKLRQAQAACNAILNGGPAPGPAPAQAGGAPDA